MWKFESSQKDECRTQSADSSKAYSRGGQPLHAWYACRTWHASTSIRHVSKASETRSSPFKWKS